MRLYLTKTEMSGARSDSEGIIWGPVLGLHEVATDAQAEALNAFPQAQRNDEIGSYRTVAGSMRFGEADVTPRGPAPKLGQHTRQVLSIDSGFTGEEIDSLVADGAVGEMS